MRMSESLGLLYNMIVVISVGCNADVTRYPTKSLWIKICTVDICFSILVKLSKIIKTNLVILYLAVKCLVLVFR